MWYLRNFFVLFCLPPKISPFRISLIIEKNRKEQQQQQDGVCWEHVSVLSRLVRHTRQRNWRSSLSYYVPRSRRAFDYVVWLPSLKHTVKIKPLWLIFNSISFSEFDFLRSFDFTASFFMSAMTSSFSLLNCDTAFFFVFCSITKNERSWNNR